jgi:hypothetical protein
VNAARAARQTSRVMTLPAGQSSTRTRLACLAIGWVFFANGAALGSWVPHIPDAKLVAALVQGARPDQVGRRLYPLSRQYTL